MPKAWHPGNFRRSSSTPTSRGGWHFSSPNDRLQSETSVAQLSESDETPQTPTTHTWDHTQQTGKSVVRLSASDAPTPIAIQQLVYNLQGRLSLVTNETYNDTGELTGRKRAHYTYDRRSFRVRQEIEQGTTENAEPTWTHTSVIEFLADHLNHTGYTQALREQTTNADGSTETVDYTFGNDEITQRSVERDANATINNDTTHIFGHDGHRSLKVLYRLVLTAGNLIAQIASYYAYGVMLASHNGASVVIATSAWSSTLNYSGEAWDTTLNRGYNRARWYDASLAQWNRLDPFAGNMQDPQSLHKHGEKGVRKKVSGTVYCQGVFFGRPRGRMVASRRCFLAVDSA